MLYYRIGKFKFYFIDNSGTNNLKKQSNIKKEKKRRTIEFREEPVGLSIPSKNIFYLFQKLSKVVKYKNKNYNKWKDLFVEG